MQSKFGLTFEFERSAVGYNYCISLNSIALSKLQIDQPAALRFRDFAYRDRLFAGREVIAQPVGKPLDTGRSVLATKDPTPQIGSGGNDMYLFTKTHAALNADNKLKAEAIIISSNAGVVTLTGKVGNAAQKAKTEQHALASCHAALQPARNSTLK